MPQVKVVCQSDDDAALMWPVINASIGTESALDGLLITFDAEHLAKFALFFKNSWYAMGLEKTSVPIYFMEDL